MSTLGGNIAISLLDMVRFHPHSSRCAANSSQGLRIMAFGVIYDFDRKPPIRITTAANLTKQKWFQEAVRKEHIDLFVLIGHNPLKTLKNNISTINILLNYIQGARPDIPVQVFGGHSHIRY